jgi:hypothetical protein
MRVIEAKKVKVEQDKLFISTNFRTYCVERHNISKFKVLRVSSLFDEIGIEILTKRKFLITERLNGFFDLAKFLRLEDIFGPLWYRDAEDGRHLEQPCPDSV